MIMNETTGLVFAIITGFLTGVLFFGGLWWTLKKVVTSQRAALWLICSMFLRVSITLAGFYFVSDAHWERILSCLLGFLLARTIVLRMTHEKMEIRHAFKS